MSDYFPKSVLVKILSNLPVKSLLRFICVSKSWQALITSHDFINIHLTKSINNKHLRPLILLRHCSLTPNQEHFSLRFDDQSFHQYSEFKSPFKSQYFFRVVGTCNGLVCLSDDLFGETHRVILWNPMIRRHVTLPVPNFTAEEYAHQSVFGFGFDSRTSDFEVVRVIYPQHEWMGKYAAFCPKVEVYSLKSCAWKTINCGVPSSYNFIEFCWQHVFLNGCSHWIGYKRLGDSMTHNVILSFDFGTEVFGKLSLPESLASEYPFSLGLRVVHNMMHLDFVYGSAKWMSLWVMREYGVVESWTKLYNVAMPDGVSNLSGVSNVFGLRQTGELLIATNVGDFISYDCGSKHVEKLGMRSVKCSMYADSYVESLVLLNRTNGDNESQCGRFDSIGDSVEGEREEVDEGTLEEAVRSNFNAATTACVTGSILQSLIREHLNW